MLGPASASFRRSASCCAPGASALNLAQWRAHLLLRLGQQVAVSGDAVLAALLEELRALPGPDGATAAVLVPLELAAPAGVLRFISTTTVFGTPVDITLGRAGDRGLLPGRCGHRRAAEAGLPVSAGIAAAAPNL